MRDLAQLEKLMLCKLCESATEYFGAQRILQAFDARYLRCTRCGFVFVEQPTWLEKAYELPIAAADTGIVVRNLRFADLVGALIDLALPDAGQFLDFGGGAGLFVRLMRDRGYNFYRQDKYCDNIFATGFDAAADQKFDLATCIEVIEHIVEPMSIFRQLAALAPTVLVATELLPPVRNRPGEWWYYAPEGGQHISFFSTRALQVVADTLGMQLASNGRNVHVFSRTPISARLVRTIANRRGLPLARAWVRISRRRRRSLTHSDAAAARAPEASPAAAD
jgi:hypothetical protein